MRRRPTRAALEVRNAMLEAEVGVYRSHRCRPRRSLSTLTVWVIAVTGSLIAWGLFLGIIFAAVLR